MEVNRESMDYDVVVVGAGPSGLATAIKIKQLNPDINVCILEKGSEVGAHILSGNVFETRALDELIPDWREKDSPIKTKVSKEKFLFLSKNKSLSWPTWLLPSVQKNHNNYIISLANLCRWLATEAENLGVEIFPGFAASKILYSEDNKVLGVQTGDMGIDKNGKNKDSFEPGINSSSALVSKTLPLKIWAPTSDPFSKTQTLISGFSCFSLIAVDRPDGPAPTTTTS